MVPYSVTGQPLGFLLVEYFFMTLVFVWEVCLRGFCFLRMDCDTPYKIPVTVNGSWYILPSWGKGGSFGVIGSENNGELGVVDPSLFPVDFWLVGGKPWVSQDSFLFADMSQEEA